MSKLAIIAGVLAAALVAETAVASPIYCGPRKAVVALLTGRLHQQLSSVAITNDGQLLEVLKSSTDLGWAMLLTSPRGLSCVIAEGDNWQTKKIDSIVQDPQM